MYVPIFTTIAGRFGLLFCDWGVWMKAKLAQFNINRLFGLYDHQIVFRLEQHITIIIGPNGRGKTVCLKFIEALFRKRFNYFVDIPFDTAEFIFTNGDIINLERRAPTSRRQI